VGNASWRKIEVIDAALAMSQTAGKLEVASFSWQVPD
jgi:hypothetical protein